jgi:hypothetical protein
MATLTSPVVGSPSGTRREERGAEQVVAEAIRLQIASRSGMACAKSAQDRTQSGVAGERKSQVREKGRHLPVGGERMNDLD